MTGAWINLSARWSMTSVQAAVNVIVSVIGTVGIWSFSRYWWQRGCTRVLRDNSGVPLPALCTIASPGESWDVCAVLRRRLLAKENWRLLFQIVIVIVTTIACIFSGPISEGSLRGTQVVISKSLSVLQTSKGDGFVTDLLESTVLWNQTIVSMNEAEFPYDQLLDYFITASVPWIYVPSEWDPSWTMQCTYTPETVLHNVTAPGNHTLYDTLKAFPALAESYDPRWLNASRYRMQSDWMSWQVQTGEPNPPFTDVLFFVLIESDPEIDDRMHTNNGTLEMSITVFHARNFRIALTEDVTEGGSAAWQPLGPVQNASFSRVECNVTQRPDRIDPDAVPWPWTNDTYSFTRSIRTYWEADFMINAAKGRAILTPSPQELLRFYQAYFITAGTLYSEATTRMFSVWEDMIQVSVVFVVVIGALALLTLVQTIRYFVFLRKYRQKLEEVHVPDGKLDWMIHSAKTTGDGDDEADGKPARDRDYFRAASFGYVLSAIESIESRAKFPGLPRVYTNKGASLSSFKTFMPTAAGLRPLPTFTFSDRLETQVSEQRSPLLTRPSRSISSQTTLAISQNGASSTPESRDHSPRPDGKALVSQTELAEAKLSCDVAIRPIKSRDDGAISPLTPAER